MDKGQFLLYQTPDGDSQIEVKLQNDTVWLSLDQMAELFQRNKSTISRHVKNVLEDGELQEEATIANFATVQNEGTRKVERVIAYYNLDMIISVGYRVHSYRGVQFRIWATKVLKEYIVKGFAMNDDLLKRAGGGNYFDELLARIRDIRSSEKVFYRKVHRPMYMKDWINILDDFLRISQKDILTHAGKISAKLAKGKPSMNTTNLRSVPRTTSHL